MRWIVCCSAFLALSGCALNQERTAEPDLIENEVVTIQKEFAPQVWSDHKVLEINESQCADKGMVILSSLGFKDVVRSSHGAYVYGNYSNNRAAIKCTTVEGKTLVYAVVAGPNVEVVKRLRNEIVWQL